MLQDFDPIVEPISTARLAHLHISETLDTAPCEIQWLENGFAVCCVRRANYALPLASSLLVHPSLARNGNWPLRPPKFEAVYLES